jgi:hypothetical protein
MGFFQREVSMWQVRLLMLVSFLPCASGINAEDRGAGWRRHVIDGSSRGADGVRLLDVNGDGRLDIATGWEEGGVIRAYRNPGFTDAKAEWPGVTVGEVKSPEDAVFVDVDGDGAVDVISSCEGRERTMFIHWAPAEKKEYLNPNAWKTEAIPASQNAQSWMFCLPLQMDGRNGVDLVAGSKGPSAEVGWFEAPANPRELSGWQWHPIYKAGWIMTILARDMDGDGDLDLIITDRKGQSRGCHWLENPGPGPKQKQAWPVHSIGGKNKEVMFLAAGDIDQDGREDLAAAVKDSGVLIFRRTAEKPAAWETIEIPMPAETGTGKGVAIADVDGDGQNDLVVTCENAVKKTGVFWLSRDKSVPFAKAKWTAHEISGKAEGVKYDLVELIDLDGDGDLDVLTCEERDNLGVIWYENPGQKASVGRQLHESNE